MTAERRSCPGCQSALQVFHARDATRGAQAAQVEIDRCFFCGGFFFDAGELERVTGRSLRPEYLAGSTDHACAACGVAMAPAVVREVAADVCPGCQSTFVEAGVVEQLAGGEVALRRPENDPMAEGTGVELTFRCRGCGDELPYDEGRATRWGLSCADCFCALDSESSTVAPPGNPDAPLWVRRDTSLLGDSWGGWGGLLWKIFRD